MTFFILGSHSDLARAEIISVIGLNSKIVAESSTVMIVDRVDASNVELQNRLGGTIKIGKIIEEFEGSDARACVEKIVNESKIAKGKNKITFGLSAYDLGNEKVVKRIVQSFRVVGGEIKKLLKETGRPVRFVEAKEDALSSVVVDTNGLIESGGEFCFFATESSIILGKTETVQNFKAWSDRDYGRPCRDSRSGMLPPKLARMMINLSKCNPFGSTLLDLFCGSGTILMEAELMGFEKVIGSDISEKAIEDTRENLDWLHKMGLLRLVRPIAPPTTVELFVSKAETIENKIKSQVDVIVAETYLGPPKRNNNRSQMEKMILDLMKMYKASLISLEKILKPGGSMVIAFPAFVTKTDLVKLPLKKMIETVGLKFDRSWIYKRPDQMTAREIVRITKTG